HGKAVGKRRCKPNQLQDLCQPRGHTRYPLLCASTSMRTSCRTTTSKPTLKTSHTMTPAGRQKAKWNKNRRPNPASVFEPSFARIEPFAGAFRPTNFNVDRAP